MKCFRSLLLTRLILLAYTLEDGTAVDKNNELKAVIAGIETKDLKGTAGVTNLDVDFTVTLSQGIFAKDIPVDTDVSTWFTSNGSNLPVGVYAKTIEKISAGDTSCKLKIYGTPKYKNSSQLCLYTPESCVIGYKYNYGR